MKKLTILVFLLITSFIASYAQRTACYNTSWLLWNGSHGTGTNSFIELNISDQSITFYTNIVCGAEHYIWTIDGSISRITSEPQITLRAQDFVWLPAGGCSDFNKKLEINRFSEVGTYTAIFTVGTNVTSPVTTPIKINGVQKCYDINTPRKQDPAIGN